MKTKNISIALVLLFSFTFINVSISQNCDRLDMSECVDDPGDFDFRSQSKVVALAPGDTITTKMAVYSGQLYRFMICNDPDLGQVEVEIFSRKKRYRKIIKEIYYKEKKYYSSVKDGGGHYDKQFRKSQSVIVKIIVPPGDPDYVGCLNLLVGRKKKSRPTYTRYTSGREG